jgi:hypothetical protein
VLFGFVDVVVFEFFAEIDLASDFEPPGFNNRRSLSSATVAWEQVAVEVTATRMVSAVTFKEDILEQNKKRYAIKIQTLSNDAARETNMCQGCKTWR